MNNPRKDLIWLLAGDVLAVLIVTIIGFIDHYRAVTGWRWLSTFVPVLASWFAVAPWLGVYDRQRSRQIRQVWRPALAAFLAAPLAAVLRGLWLNSAVLPIFALVLGATSALGFLIWRSLWTWIVRRIDRNG